jgi:hypothetical protein
MKLKRMIFDEVFPLSELKIPQYCNFMKKKMSQNILDEEFMFFLYS